MLKLIWTLFFALVVETCAHQQAKPETWKKRRTMKKRSILLLLGLLLMTASASFAVNGAANTNVYSPTLTVSATIQDAVNLTLSTGTTAGINHCAVAGTNPTYTMSFGTVDALGVNAGNCNLFTPTTPGQTAAVYYTDYTLTPQWAGLTASTSASITAWAASLETGLVVQVPTTTDQSTTTGLTVSSWQTLGTAIGSATTVVSGTALSAAGADGTAMTRFLALSVSPTAAPGAGLSTTVTYTMTIK